MMQFGFLEENSPRKSEAAQGRGFKGADCRPVSWLKRVLFFFGGRVLLICSETCLEVTLELESARLNTGSAVVLAHRVRKDLSAPEEAAQHKSRSNGECCSVVQWRTW